MPVPYRRRSLLAPCALLAALLSLPLLAGAQTPSTAAAPAWPTTWPRTLHVLLSALCPVVVVLARPVQGAKLPPPWKAPLEHGEMAVVSAIATPARLTTERAMNRNLQVAKMANQIVVAHASPGGELAALVVQWQNEGRPVAVLSGS